jgi:integrase
LLEQCVLPRLGKFRVADLSRADVVHFHHRMRATPTQANRALSLLSKMLNLAELWGLRDDGTNPCRHLQRYRERRFERFLSEAEFQQLGVAIVALESSGEISAAAAAAVRVLIFSGARRGEICRLRWEQLDTEHACARLPDSKTGAKTIPLSAKALEVIAGLRRRSPWVFPTEEGSQPIDLSRPWERIRERAGMPTLRVHDLRHSHASVLAGAGVPLVVIGRILGHATPATTARYAHLADHAVRSATELASERIAAAISRESPPAP